MTEPPPTTRRPSPELLSIVVPAYNESGNLRVLAEALSDVLGDVKYELIFVDDGSGDDTFEQIARLSRQDGRIRGLSLSRNFGHQYALAAGLKHARGQAVVMMDGDMQHPPALVPELIDKWRQGYNVVQTVRSDTHRTPLLKRITSKAFYRIFSALCGIAIDPGMADFRLLDRRVVDEINAMDEGRIFLRGLLAWMGYKRAIVPFEVGLRHSGSTKYSVRKMLTLAKTGIFAFSSMPLRIATTLGLVMAVLGLAEFAYLVWSSHAYGAVEGWAITAAVLTLLFGMLFLLVGIQGEYIIRIHDRVRRRPPFLIERTVGGDEDDDDPKPQ